MKKVFTLLTIVAMGISVVGCGEEKKEKKKEDKAAAAAPAADGDKK